MTRPPPPELYASPNALALVRQQRFAADAEQKLPSPTATPIDVAVSDSNGVEVLQPTISPSSDSPSTDTNNAQDHSSIELQSIATDSPKVDPPPATSTLAAAEASAAAPGASTAIPEASPSPSEPADPSPPRARPSHLHLIRVFASIIVYLIIALLGKVQDSSFCNVEWFWGHVWWHWCSAMGCFYAIVFSAMVRAPLFKCRALLVVDDLGLPSVLYYSKRNEEEHRIARLLEYSVEQRKAVSIGVPALFLLTVIFTNEWFGEYWTRQPVGQYQYVRGVITLALTFVLILIYWIIKPICALCKKMWRTLILVE